MSTKRPTTAELREMTQRAIASQGLKSGLTPKSPTDIALEKGISVIRLRVKDVAFFEKNPRLQVNPLYEEIRNSIEERDLDQPLQVTKRPGDSFYTLAKGGKTRLLALQELAERNPAKWEQHDFLEVAYVSEAELLTAHLVENLQRSDMTFWDTAQGIVSMREALAQEAGRALSQRDFAQALKSRGLEIAQTTLIDYIFALAHYEKLGEMKQQLARNDMRNVLRPGHSALAAVWSMHSGRTEEEFDRHYHEWVANYPLTHGAYAPDVLQTHVHALTAQALGYSEASLSAMLQALKLRPQSTLHELMAPPIPIPPPTPLPASPLPNPPWDGSMQGQSGADQGDEGIGAGAQDTGTQPPSPAGFDGFSGESSGIPSDEGLKNLAQTLSNRPGAGRDTLRVASGLVPNPPKGAQAPQPEFGAAPYASQFDLMGMSAMDVAFESLQAALEQFADVAGISPLVQSSGLRYRFYVEMPEPGLIGTSKEDLAVQAWWFLANLSGQLLIEEGVLEAMEGELLALPDTGEHGFRFAASNEDVWPTAVVERLGGVTLLEFTLAHDVLTDPVHPLRDVAFVLLTACRDYTAAQREAGHAGH